MDLLRGYVRVLEDGAVSAAAYCRVSTGEQAQGLSLDAQRAACQRYAAARSWALSRVYEDVETGRRNDRAQFTALRRRLPEYGAVITWKLDRIARRAIDALTFVEECEDSHTAFVSVTEGFDTSNAMGRAALGVASLFAQLESDHVSERVRSSIRHQLDLGRLPWRAPYGYHRNGDGTVELDADETAVVRRIFEQRIAGITHTEIARRLDGEGRDKRGRPWTRQAVTFLLDSPGYMGSPITGRSRLIGRRRVWLPRSEWQHSEGLLPAIVTQEQWQDAQRHRLRGRRPGRPALLRGLLICRDCEQRWHARTIRQKSIAYVCSGKRNGCHAPQVLEREALSALDAALRDLRSAGAWAAIEFDDGTDHKEALEAVEQRASRAWLAFVEGGVGLAVVRAAQRDLMQAETLVSIGTSPPLPGPALREAVARCRDALRAGGDEGNRALRQVLARAVLRREPLGMELVFWPPA